GGESPELTVLGLLLAGSTLGPMRDQPADVTLSGCPRTTEGAGRSGTFEPRFVRRRTNSGAFALRAEVLGMLRRCAEGCPDEPSRADVAAGRNAGTGADRPGRLPDVGTAPLQRGDAQGNTLGRDDGRASCGIARRRRCGWR